MAVSACLDMILCAAVYHLQGALQCTPKVIRVIGCEMVPVRWLLNWHLPEATEFAGASRPCKCSVSVSSAKLPPKISALRCHDIRLLTSASPTHTSQAHTSQFSTRSRSLSFLQAVCGCFMSRKCIPIGPIFTSSHTSSSRKSAPISVGITLHPKLYPRCNAHHRWSPTRTQFVKPNLPPNPRPLQSLPK